jgi:hypothetical protein
VVFDNKHVKIHVAQQSDFVFKFFTQAGAKALSIRSLENPSKLNQRDTFWIVGRRMKLMLPQTT